MEHMEQVEIYLIKDPSGEIHQIGRRRTGKKNGFSIAQKHLNELSEEYGPGCEIEVIQTFPVNTPDLHINNIILRLQKEHDCTKHRRRVSRSKISYYNNKNMDDKSNCDVEFVFSHSRNEFFLIKKE